MVAPALGTCTAITGLPRAAPTVGTAAAGGT